MNNFKRCWLVIAGLVFSLVVCSHALANGFEHWQSMPKEVRGITLRKLLEAGDYKTFMNTYKTSHTMREVIDADPVLLGTLQGFKDPELEKLMKELPNKTAAATNGVEPIINKIIEVSDRASGVPEVRSQIVTNLGYALFAELRKLADHWLRTEMVISLHLFANIGSSIPKEYLPMFDQLLSYSIHEVPLNPRAEASKALMQRYLVVLCGLGDLTQNRNIPTSLVLDRINQYIAELQGAGVTGVEDKINSALGSLAKRTDIDEKTIEYFQEKEGNPVWQRVPGLKRALENFKSNPASKGPS